MTFKKIFSQFRLPLDLVLPLMKASCNAFEKQSFFKTVSYFYAIDHLDITFEVGNRKFSNPAVPKSMDGDPNIGRQGSKNGSRQGDSNLTKRNFFF